MTEVPVQRQHIGLGGFAANGEDAEMPDITREKFPEMSDIMREKFPAGLAVTGMIVSVY